MNTTELTSARVMCFVATARPDEAKQFYYETLGLPFLAEDDFSLTFSVHEALTLRVQKFPDLTPQPFTVFGWQVDNLEEVVTSLAERGIKFENFGFPMQDAHGICTFPNGDKVVWFKDPDGNTLSLAQIAG